MVKVVWDAMAVCLLAAGAGLGAGAGCGGLVVDREVQQEGARVTVRRRQGSLTRWPPRRARCAAPAVVLLASGALSSLWLVPPPRGKLQGLLHALSGGDGPPGYFNGQGGSGGGGGSPGERRRCGWCGCSFLPPKQQLYSAAIPGHLHTNNPQPAAAGDGGDGLRPGHRRRRSDAEEDGAEPGPGLVAEVDAGRRCHWQQTWRSPFVPWRGRLHPPNVSVMGGGSGAML